MYTTPVRAHIYLLNIQSVLLPSGAEYHQYCVYQTTSYPSTCRRSFPFRDKRIYKSYNAHEFLKMSLPVAIHLNVQLTKVQSQI